MELFKTLINSLVQNWFLYLISLLLFIACWILKQLYPKFRGFMGEFWIKRELKKLPVDDYIVINDIMIKDDHGTHQIDHLVISKYGIFVIEMKNYYGLIRGSQYQNTWTQYLGKKKYYFQNPIHQNYGHIKTLSSVLNINEDKFISIVCFSNQVKLVVSSNSEVTQMDLLVEVIKKYHQEIFLENIKKVQNKILTLSMDKKSERKKHILEIQEKLLEENKKINNMICPRCSGKLVKKRGKYGDFLGCLNYPKCKYTKPCE